MSTVQMNASAIGGTINLPNTGTVTVPSSGIITVDSRDAIDLLRSGAKYVSSRTVRQDLGIPIAAAVGQFVASASFANGTLSIANQPDVPRLASVRIWPGTSAITAGNVAVNYLGNDGQTITDNISAVTNPTTAVSTNLSRGLVHLNSVIITGVAGGTSPGIQMDSLASLALTIDPGFFNFTGAQVFVDNVDSGIVSVQSTAACITPSTAPNGTHTYSALGSFGA